MKDRYYILILAIILALLNALTFKKILLTDGWTFLSPIISFSTITVILFSIQRKKNHTFSRHLLKSLKVGFFAHLIYFPLFLLLNLKLQADFTHSINSLAAFVPMALGSTFVSSIVFLPVIIITSILTYVICWLMIKENRDLIF